MEQVAGALGLSVQQVIQASQNKLVLIRFVIALLGSEACPFHLPDDPIIKKIALHLEHLKHEPNCPKFSCNFCFVLTLSTLLGPLLNLSPAVPAIATFTLLESPP